MILELGGVSWKTTTFDTLHFTFTSCTFFLTQIDLKLTQDTIEQFRD